MRLPGEWTKTTFLETLMINPIDLFCILASVICIIAALACFWIAYGLGVLGINQFGIGAGLLALGAITAKISLFEAK